MTFQVGDRVVGSSRALSHRIGDSGTIKVISQDGGYWVLFDSDGTINYVFAVELELIHREAKRKRGYAKWINEKESA